MTRLSLRRLLPPPLLLAAPLLLAGCGSETADPAGPAEIAARANPMGIAPEHVYVIEANGFDVAEQSVGVSGDDGFSAHYVSQGTGGQLHLRVDRGALTDADCAEQPVAGTSGTTRCTRDGNAWYRATGDRREYAVPKDGHVVHVTGGPDVPRDVLREAALGARRPSPAELDELFSDAPDFDGSPVERGDLPTVGDGAPDNEPGVGG